MARRAKDKPVTALRVTQSGYEPFGPYDAEFHAQFALGAQVTATIEQNRSVEQNQLYWGFLDFVVKNSDWTSDARSLSKSLLHSLGYFEEFTALMDGSIHPHPRSLAEMDHQEFRVYCNKAFDEIYLTFGLDVETYKQSLRHRGRRS